MHCRSWCQTLPWVCNLHRNRNSDFSLSAALSWTSHSSLNRISLILPSVSKSATMRSFVTFWTTKQEYPRYRWAISNCWRDLITPHTLLALLPGRSGAARAPSVVIFFSVRLVVRLTGELRVSGKKKPQISMENINERVGGEKRRSKTIPVKKQSFS